jgi:hypothetical protein
MEYIAKSAASMLSTESLGEWAGQSSPVKNTPFFNDNERKNDHTGLQVTKTDDPTTSAQKSTKVHEDTLKVTVQSQRPSRSPSPRPAEPHLSPAARAARIAALTLAQAKTHIPETARMTKSRRAPCCEWKHEDFKHSLHMSWLHHYPPSKN